MKITELQLRMLIRSRLLCERRERESDAESKESSKSSGTGGSESGSDDSGTFSGQTGGGGGPGERDSSGSAVVIKMPKEDGGFDNPTLVYVYPGIGSGGYGQQGWVADAIDGSDIGSEPNRIVVVADKKDTSWSTFKDQGIDAYKEATGEDSGPDSAKMVGWSAGANGLSQATSDNYLSMIWYADPSPIGRLISASHGNVKMYYNPGNWGDMFPSSSFTNLSDSVPNATRVDEDHNDIFYTSMKESLA